MSGIDAKNPEPGMEIRGRFGQYKLVKQLGKGGNGTVFSVEVIFAEKQLPEGENFVVKILTAKSHSDKERKKREDRFQKEIRCISQFQEEIEGIIPIYDASCFIEEQGDLVWYLMPKALEYKFKGIRSTEEKLIGMRDIGQCIAQLHARNYVHRDIKPQNLLVYKNRVCLSDFGLVLSMDETEEHITDTHEGMGPMTIRPPEMRSIDKLDKIDYKKSDVYLFAKTVWIILTGMKGGFPEEYKRSEKRFYLDKKKLRIETAEPLHEMLESATKHYLWDRIDISMCVQHINDQLDIIAKRASDADLGKWKYIETVKEIYETISPDIKIYQEAHSIQEVLERMAGTVNLFFEEAGKAYGPMLLKSVKFLRGNLFELDIKNIYYNDRKKIVIEIEKISMKKDLSCVMETKIISAQPDNMPIFENLNKALRSMYQQICISGIYSIRFVQAGVSFH